MGANNSRLHGNGGEVLPARIRSRIQELRQRKSKRKGLNFDVDGGKSQSCKENEGGHGNKGSLNDVQQAKRVEKLSKVVPLPVSEEKGKDVGKKDEKVNSAWLQQGDIKYGSYDYEDEDDEDDDIESGRNIGPSSPSFKIYCSEYKNKQEEEFPESKDLDDDENQIVAVLQKSSTDNSIESFASASAGNKGNSNEIVKIKSASKKKGKMKFEAMKKNLLYVRHMNRMKPALDCTGNADRRHLTDH